MIIKLNEKTVKIQIFDTGGLENFQEIRRTYYKGAIGVLLVYDITRRETFINVTKYLEEIKHKIPELNIIILIGNKKNLENKRIEVSFEEGKSFAEKNDFIFCETSVKSNYNIVKDFIKFTQYIYIKKTGSEIFNAKLKDENDFEIKLTEMD